jgi:uncharacterized metal-binding protein
MGALIGVVITPDLDVDHGKVVSYKLIRQRLGQAPYYYWSGVWYMYRRSLKHGGELSHFPVIGTLGRLVYLFLFVIVIPYLFLAPVLHFDIWSELNWWAWEIIEHYKIVLGLMGADFIHWALDVSTTEHKERRKHDVSRGYRNREGQERQSDLQELR